jgi:hypothetical protein
MWGGPLYFGEHHFQPAVPPGSGKIPQLGLIEAPCSKLQGTHSLGGSIIRGASRACQPSESLTSICFLGSFLPHRCCPLPRGCHELIAETLFLRREAGFCGLIGDYHCLSGASS